MNDEKNKAIHALVRPDPPGKDGWGLVVERAKAWVVTKRYYPRMDNSQQHEMLADFAIQIRDKALADREAEIAEALEKARQSRKRYEACFTRIAEAMGVSGGLEISANAQNDEENSAEILTRMLEHRLSPPTSRQGE